MCHEYPAVCQQERSRAEHACRSHGFDVIDQVGSVANSVRRDATCRSSKAHLLTEPTGEYFSFCTAECCSTKIGAMGSLVLAFISYVRAFFVPRHKLALEAAAPATARRLETKEVSARLTRVDRLFWTALRRMYASWAYALIIVQRETVVSWHRTGFRLFWRWRSRRKSGIESSSRSSRSDPSDERRLSAVGRPWHARRVAPTRVRRFRACSLAILATRQASRRDQSETLASISEQPSRGHRRVRLLHRPDLEVSNTLLFFVIEHSRRRIPPAQLRRLEGESIADKELSVLLARDQLVLIVHGTTYEALREVSPMLASRTGLSTAENPMGTVAAKPSSSLSRSNDGVSSGIKKPAIRNCYGRISTLRVDNSMKNSTRKRCRRSVNRRV